MLSRHRCGTVYGGKFESFLASIRAIMNDGALYAHLSRKAHANVCGNHDTNIIIPMHERALISVLPQPSHRGSRPNAEGATQASTRPEQSGPAANAMRPCQGTD
jgi:hypothetical protein